MSSRSPKAEELKGFSPKEHTSDHDFQFWGRSTLELRDNTRAGARYSGGPISRGYFAKWDQQTGGASVKTEGVNWSQRYWNRSSMDSYQTSSRAWERRLFFQLGMSFEVGSPDSSREHDVGRLGTARCWCAVATTGEFVSSPKPRAKSSKLGHGLEPTQAHTYK